MRLAADLCLTKPIDESWADPRPEGQCPGEPIHPCPAALDLSPIQTTVIPVNFHVLSKQNRLKHLHIWAMPNFKDERE